MIRRDALREYSRGSLWLLPTVSILVALLLGALLSQIDVRPGSPLAFQGTADDARALLIGISSTMVTVIALLLGLAVSTAASSPRATTASPSGRGPVALPLKSRQPRSTARSCL